MHSALLRSKIEEDSRQEQETYRSSLRGGSEHSGRARERSHGSGAAHRSDARSQSSGASTSAHHEQQSSPGQAVAAPMPPPNRNSSTGRNRLQTASTSSMNSSASTMAQRESSKTSAFLARAESVLASQHRPDSEPLSPTRSHRVRRRTTLALHER